MAARSYAFIKRRGYVIPEDVRAVAHPFYDEDEAACRSMHRKVYRSFPVSRVYQAHIPTCPSGYWLFGFASKKYHPLNDLQAEKWNGLHIPTWYYTTNLHAGAFMLPKYVEDLLEEEENNK